mmetsp:Transcript_34608/g.81593  ORF Transcript_34608/g.81593 Transcript_34608/m.81593 type:complete len:142 (+) Transcript_34608:192-617(+)
MGQFKWKDVVYADEFSWDPQPDLPYPTCEVKKGFNDTGAEATSLANFAFLATLSFSSTEEAQPLLDRWFGPGAVMDDSEYVDRYRDKTRTANQPVTYKLFTIPSDPISAVVGMWHWMVDMQLWRGSIFAQLIVAVNPLGFI